MLSQLELKRVLEQRIRDIPTLPSVATKVMQILENPRSSAMDVERIIMLDQSLASRILKLVNSAYYGFPRRIGTISQSVVILGFVTVKNLVLSISVADFFFMGCKNRFFNRGELWRHSVGTAIAARILARQARFPQLEEAFMAGLLHDIGKVALDYYFPEEFADVLALIESDGISMFEAERRVFGLNHAVVGRWIADRWNLPPLLVEVIHYHHQPLENKDYWATTALVHTADILCRRAGIGSGGDSAEMKIQPHVYEWLRLSEEDYQKVMAELVEGMRQAEDFISIGREMHIDETRGVLGI
jgi:putative nucleotidyltransferase with HDIG domain